MKQMIIEAIKGNKKAIIVGAVAAASVAIFETARKAVINRASELGGMDIDGDTIIVAEDGQEVIVKEEN